MTNNYSNIIIFQISDLQFAIKLSFIEQVVNMVKIQPLPHSPECVSGTINYSGDLLPVINLRMTIPK